MRVATNAPELGANEALMTLAARLIDFISRHRPSLMVVGVIISAACFGVVALYPKAAGPTAIIGLLSFMGTCLLGCLGALTHR
jgi:hypothetical protein